MKKPIKYICIALTLGVLFISADLFWPGTSSQSPNASAEFQRGMDLINQNRFSEAIEPLTSAFEGGYIEAGYWLGFIYKYSSFPVGHYGLEKEWYTKGAKAGDPYAMLALGARKYSACSKFGKCSITDHYWRWKAKLALSNQIRKGDLDAAYYVTMRLEAPSMEDGKPDKKESAEFANKFKHLAIKGHDLSAVQYFLSEESRNKDGSATEETLKIMENISKKGGARASRFLGNYYIARYKKNINAEENYNNGISSLIRSARKNSNQAILYLADLYDPQFESEHIEDLYFYCKIVEIRGSEENWCTDKNILKDIPLSKEKIVEIDKAAAEWTKKNFLSREYYYFSGFLP